MPSIKRSSGTPRIISASGVRANNVLLWGERGTGKSSLVKALLTVFDATPLRMIQSYKHDVLTIQEMYELLAQSMPYRLILFIDDLSFEESQTYYKEMKTILDGGLERSRTILCSMLPRTAST